MKKRFRCNNCQAMGTYPDGYEFECESETVVCPKCKCDASHPKQRQFILEVVIFHFDPPTAVFNVGRNTIACQPEITVNKQGIRATGDYRIVTCEACKKTKDWQDAKNKVTDLSSTNLETVPSEIMESLGANQD